MFARVPSLRTGLAAAAAVGVLALAGCGGSDEPSGGGGGAPDVDAAVLLRDGVLVFAKDGKTIESGTFGLTVSGKVNAPEDDELRGLDGKVALVLSADKKPAGAKESDLPPFALTVDVNGAYTDAKDQRKPGDYSGGVSFIDNQFYANWNGEDYAVGEALSAQALDAIEQEAAKAGSELPTNIDTQKLVDAMDLNPETWLTDPKAENGPELDGVATYKVTGDVAIGPLLEDVVDGLRRVPDAVPLGKEGDQLSKLEDLSPEDLKKIEETITTAEVEAYIGVEDKLQRRLVVHLAGKDEEEPVDFDITLQLDSSKLGQPQGLKAPAQAAPITDLFLKLQEEFGSLFSQLGDPTARA